MKPISPNGKFKYEHQAALARAGNRCQAFPKVGLQCHRAATEVWEADGGGLVAFCRECRLKGIGQSAAEKAAATRSFAARQLTIVGADRD